MPEHLRFADDVIGGDDQQPTSIEEQKSGGPSPSRQADLQRLGRNLSSPISRVSVVQSLLSPLGNRGHAEARRSRRCDLIQEILSTPPDKCKRCQKWEQRSTADKTLFFKETAHLRQAIDKLLGHCETLMIPTLFKNVKDSLQLDVKFYSQQAEEEDEIPVQATPFSPLSASAKQCRLENDRLKEENTQLQQEVRGLRLQLSGDKYDDRDDEDSARGGSDSLNSSRRGALSPRAGAAGKPLKAGRAATFVVAETQTDWGRNETKRRGSIIACPSIERNGDGHNGRDADNHRDTRTSSKPRGDSWSRIGPHGDQHDRGVPLEEHQKVVSERDLLLLKVAAAERKSEAAEKTAEQLKEIERKRQDHDNQIKDTKSALRQAKVPSPLSLSSHDPESPSSNVSAARTPAQSRRGRGGDSASGSRATSSTSRIGTRRLLLDSEDGECELDTESEYQEIQEGTESECQEEDEEGASDADETGERRVATSRSTRSCAQGALAGSAQRRGVTMVDKCVGGGPVFSGLEDGLRCRGHAMLPGALWPAGRTYLKEVRSQPNLKPQAASVGRARDESPSPPRAVRQIDMITQTSAGHGDASWRALAMASTGEPYLTLVQERRGRKRFLVSDQGRVR